MGMEFLEKLLRDAAQIHVQWERTHAISSNHHAAWEERLQRMETTMKDFGEKQIHTEQRCSEQQDSYADQYKELKEQLGLLEKHRQDSAEMHAQTERAFA